MTKCAIIQDLLPLYADGIASADSRALVEEHIAGCTQCQQALADMKSEIKLHVPDKKAAQALRKFKHSLLKKNIIVATCSMALIIVLMIGLWNFVLTPQTPIKYEDGLLSAEISTVKYVDTDGAIHIITEEAAAPVDTLESEVLDIVSDRKTALRSVASISIEENGQHMELIFINFTENLLSKWEKGGETKYAFRVVEPHLNYYYQEDGQRIDESPIGRIEVYYVDKMIRGINIAVDYVKLRESGTLIWSGSLN